MPGAHVICANKSYTSKISLTADKTCFVWASLALAIAEDRSTEANLFIEDAGQFGNINTPPPVVTRFLNNMLRAVTKSPPGGPASQILNMTISQWEEALNLPPLRSLERRERLHEASDAAK